MRVSKPLVIGGLLLFCLLVAFNARSTTGTRNKQAQATPVVETVQLPAIGEKIPVEIQRTKVNLQTPNVINGYSCVVKNNTEKAITALSLEWTFTIENNGNETTSSEYSEMDAILHPDIKDYRKLQPLAARNETTMDNPGTLGFASTARIVKAEVSLRYIEFSDKSVIDVDQSGRVSKRINSVREGAEKYKIWLAKQYRVAGNSLKNVLPQLQSGVIPAELGLSNSAAKQGANVYRTWVLKLYESSKLDIIEKYLS